MDLRLALFAGIDIPIPELQLTLHTPTIKEIAFIGDINFFTGVQCLTISKKAIFQDETLLVNTNNFQIFMMIMTEQSEKDKKEAVLQLLSLILPNYQITFTPNSLIFYNQEETHAIDDSNFNFFQDAIKLLFCHKDAPMDAQSFNPQDEKAKEIADKLMRARARVAAQKGEEGSVFAQYISTLVVGIGSMSLNDCLNLTMYQLFDLLERYMLYVNWDLDMKSRLAGGKSDNKPDNWMKNIH